MSRLLHSLATAGCVALLASACGGGGGNSVAVNAPPVQVVPPQPVPVPTQPAPAPQAPLLHAELLAGQPTMPPHYASGTLATVGAITPVQLALDKAGNLYETDGDFVVRKITPSGQVTVLAGTPGKSGTDDGTGPNASLGSATGIAVDASGNVYVSGGVNIRKITPDGVVTTLAGQQWSTGRLDGPGNQAMFMPIQSMAIDTAGNLYVVDGELRRVSATGYVQTVQLEQHPTNLRAFALDPHGGFTFTDASRLLRYDAAGKLQQVVDLTDRTYTMPGSTEPIPYTLVSSIAYTPDGMLYAVDGLQYDFPSEAIRSIDPAGKVTLLHSRLQPAGLVNGPIATAHFGLGTWGGNGLVVDKAGNLLLADIGNYAIRKISTDLQVSTFAGGWAPPPAFADGTGTAAAFKGIAGFATDKSGNTYVADSGNCAIRKISPDHVVTTLAGMGGQCSADVDGIGTAARFSSITGMAQGPDGSLYVTENYTVRKVTPDGVVTTLAGGVGSEKQDGTGKSAVFRHLNSIAVGPGGTLLVSDGWQVPNACNSHLDNGPTSLRTITPTGVVTTLPGTEWDCGQRDVAPAVWDASDLAFDGAGNLYLVSGGYLGKRSADGVAAYLLDSKGAKIAASEVVVDEFGTVFYVYGGAVYKFGADRVVTEVLAPSFIGAGAEITPDVPVMRISALTYIGAHRFLASFDDQAVVVTLR